MCWSRSAICNALHRSFACCQCRPKYAARSNLNWRIIPFFFVALRTGDLDNGSRRSASQSVVRIVCSTILFFYINFKTTTTATTSMFPEARSDFQARVSLLSSRTRKSRIEWGCLYLVFPPSVTFFWFRFRGFSQHFVLFPVSWLPSGENRVGQ